MKLGIDRLLDDSELQQALAGKRVAILATPASVTSQFVHSMDALAQLDKVNLSAAFGPQHGIRGDKQDNMVETENSFDDELGIPIFSLYGETRRPTADMLDTFDVLLYDIQDVGCRIYTYITTLFYGLDDCSRAGKSLWVLDRPNPAGRAIEGMTLLAGQESFVGAAEMPMRHGLTMGEAARWYVERYKLEIDLQVITMQDYDPTLAPGYGWPENNLCWINPSPNLSTYQSARTFPGTVLLEGTTLSEGRGTTRALELFGAPDLPIPAILNTMQTLAPEWMLGVRYREAWFEPTFHKHQGLLCRGIQLHTDFADYNPSLFKPYRWLLLFFKALRLEMPDYPLWRDFPYEYEFERLAIDVINGGAGLREWVDDPHAGVEAMQAKLLADEQAWLEQVKPYYDYRY